MQEGPASVRPCINCLRGFTWECERGGCSSTSPVDATPVELTISSEDDYENNSPSTGGPVREIRTQSDHNLKDQQSTGRKRAAEMYPLDRSAHCEWRLKKNCGGGSKPIVGCLSGMQQARHHGPDKNTLNNEEGNVHRICHTCHNRWHTENDEGYVWGGFYDPHSPTVVEPVEAMLNESYWANRSLVKAKD